MAMSALDVISLADAKAFLVVDFNDRDAEITRHIKSAVSLIEKYTNVYLYQRLKTFTLLGESIEIYDYPIVFIDAEIRKRQMVLSVIVYGKCGDEVETGVGYLLGIAKEEEPILIEACYKLITYFYENRDAYGASIPTDIQCMINQRRRSATI